MILGDDEIDVEAAVAVGSKIIEMADRIRIADKLAPGGEARWAFELDDVRYGVTVRVEPRA